MGTATGKGVSALMRGNVGIGPVRDGRHEGAPGGGSIHLQRVEVGHEVEPPAVDYVGRYLFGQPLALRKRVIFMAMASLWCGPKHKHRLSEPDSGSIRWPLRQMHATTDRPQCHRLGEGVRRAPAGHSSDAWLGVVYAPRGPDGASSGPRRPSTPGARSAHAWSRSLRRVAASYAATLPLRKTCDHRRSRTSLLSPSTIVWPCHTR
jgi:hypothetical protein